MKAEHRKELETNVLADRMGRLLDNVKQKPQRGTVFFVVLTVVVVVLAVVGVRWYRYSNVENSEAWYYSYFFFDVAQSKERESAKELAKLVTESHGEKAQGRFVRFQENWRVLWERGILMLGADPRGAREALRFAAQEYERLKEECAGDPVLVPEALYGQAIVEETLALEDRKHLDTAIELYQQVVKDHPKSAYGKLSEKRLEVLTDETKRQDVSELYQELQRDIRFDGFERKFDPFNLKK